MRMRFMPDDPVAADGDDALRIAPFIDLLQRSLVATTPPFVYGILGDWGTGKTSALRLLERRLEGLREGDRMFVPIWFNAWRYENEANLVYPLLHTIRRSYDARFPAGADREPFLRSFARVVTTSALMVTDGILRMGTKAAVGEALTLADARETLAGVVANERQPEDRVAAVLARWANSVDDLHDAFEQLLAAYARSFLAARGLPGAAPERVTFVILVDDLDRCLPETAVAILESLKNHLGVPNCIFALALNQHVVYQGIRVKYRGLEINGQEYLEKILSYSFYLPEPQPEDVATFATARLRALIAPEDWATYEPYCAVFGEILRRSGFSNPRKIKRVLNRYLFFLSGNAAELERFDREATVRLLVIAEYYPAIFQLLLREDKALAEQLRQVGTASFSPGQFAQSYGVDLTPIYPQLARHAQLFHFTARPGVRPLHEHAQAVFRIARLI